MANAKKRGRFGIAANSIAAVVIAATEWEAIRTENDIMHERCQPNNKNKQIRKKRQLNMVRYTEKNEKIEYRTNKEHKRS